MGWRAGFGRIVVWGAGGAVVVAVLVGVRAPAGLELAVSPREGGAPLLVLPLRVGERVTLRYVHSVDHTPIWDVLSVDEAGAIHVESERFAMFGAGMGHWPGHGRLTRRGRHQIIENIHRQIGSFVLRVGSPAVDHTLIWRGIPIPLAPHATGRAVRVSARRVCRLGQLWRTFRSSPGEWDDG